MEVLNMSDNLPGPVFDRIVETLKAYYGESWTENRVENRNFALGAQAAFNEAESVHLIGDPEFEKGQIHFNLWIDTVMTDAGFGISEIHLAGNSRVPPETILAALGMRPGESIEVCGPLGNGFSTAPVDHLIMVAGGIGQTPFLALAREALGIEQFGDPARASGYARRVSFCYGVRTADYLAALEMFQEAGVEVHIWTINDPAEMERLLDAGVDGIVTDRADLGLALLARRRDRTG